MKIIISIFIFSSLVLLSYDKGFKMIKEDGTILYSEDGVRWYHYKNLAFKYIINSNEFNFYYDFDKKPNKINTRKINGATIELNWSYTNGAIRFEFPTNGIYIINFKASNHNIVLVIIKN